MNITKFYCNNTKIAHLIRNDDDLFEEEAVSARVGKDLVVQFGITQKLTNFDCDVADAIYTIYRNKYTTFTPGQVLRVLSGDDKQTIIEKQQISNY